MNGSTLTLSLVGALALGAAMGKRGSRARDEQQARVIEALHAWKGDPSSIQLHLMDEAIRAPNPSSRSGRKQREWARALLAELAVHARPSRTPLYRGDHEAPHGIQSWTTRRAVAARWAKKRQGGRVHVLPAGTRGLRIHDYVGDSVYERGGSEGTNEAEWIMQTPETALGQERIARLAATMRQHGSRATDPTSSPAFRRWFGGKRGSRATFNPYAGKRTMGPPEDLIQRMVSALYSETSSTNPESLDLRSFASGVRHAGDFRVQRADGTFVSFLLLVEADPENDPHIEGSIGTYRGVGTYHGSKVVVIRVPSEPFVRLWSRWEDKLRPVIAHEVTHLMDPGIKIVESRGIKSLEQLSPKTDTEWLEYLNDPAEVVARRHEVRVEILRSPMPQTALRMIENKEMTRGEIVATLLLGSMTWRKVKNDFTPANKRLFYEMAANLLTELESEQ